MRNFDRYKGKTVKEEDVINVANWKPQYETKVEVPFYPYRVVMQDFTGVPAVVDLAAMRNTVKELGKDSSRINPAVPVDLIVDHSVQVDYYGSHNALVKNLEMEYQRNNERYSLLKWAQKTFDRFRIFPPGAGIIHQVNLEYLAKVVAVENIDGHMVAFPDTLVGTDSHTTMINGIGIIGWGVGGIEAESAILGQPIYIKIPEVIGVKLIGTLPPGSTATDLVLTITQLLRKENVVEKFVEFFGPGIHSLPLPDRATIANMAPEYGATVGYFPVDQQVLDYLALTGREEIVELVEMYSRLQGIFYTHDEHPQYTKEIILDLATVQPSLAGPSRPQDRVLLQDIKSSFEDHINNLSTDQQSQKKEITVTIDNQSETLTHGSVVIAAITSCTNTSNPRVLIGAGLLARNAVQRGLKVKKYVKTSFAPGSRAVGGYMEKTGLMPYLEKLGFNIIAYGCTTCIGNSGPLHPSIEAAIRENHLVAAAVLSGNRNFEARIHQEVKANYLASPPLVVAFALAGTVQIDMQTQPLGIDIHGKPVFLKDIWPQPQEIIKIMQQVINPAVYKEKYANILEGDKNWQDLPIKEGDTFDWNQSSTYIRRVPFLDDFNMTPPKLNDIIEARLLLMLGDSVTTDHISPAGAIDQDYPAGQYLIHHQVTPQDFNSYGSRRGNHEVMMRGTFGNIRIKNKLVSPVEGGYTRILPQNEQAYIFDAATEYKKQGVPLIIIAGKEYGTGSSRDWAAKGTLLLGVRAVIAESFERIHRSNLIGMGVLPLQFEPSINPQTLGLTGTERFTIKDIDSVSPGKPLTVTVVSDTGKSFSFNVISRLDTEIEVAYYKHQGILPYVLREMIVE